MGKIMGIDYGSHRVGVAVSDDGGMYAFPKAIVANDEDLLNTLAQLAEREGVTKFVVGEADNPAGGENTIMRRVTIFSKALAVRTELPVELVTEAYSSAEARRALEEKIRTRKDTSTAVDAAAAAIILQTYLDTTRTSR
jgi:putative Holliday junction resolvase